MPRPPLRSALAVVAFVALLVVGAVDARSRTTDRGLPDEDPVLALVTAWRTSRTATFRAEGTTTRTAEDGTSLTARSLVVQRPPDRLVVAYGEIAGRRDDRALACPTPFDGSPRTCGLAAPDRPFDEVVEDEVATFASLVGGIDPLYGVRRRSRDCWELTRVRYDPRSGFGVVTELCFDPATGAVARQRTEHGTVVEETVHGDITATVSDADLAPPLGP